jgi:hypothetical protein
MILGAMFLRTVTERYGPHVVLNATILRAMRSVSCDAYQVHSSLYRVLLTNQGPFKAGLNAFVPEERALEDLGA